MALHREVAPIAQPHGRGDGLAGAPADRGRAGRPVPFLHRWTLIAVGARLRRVLPLLAPRLLPRPRPGLLALPVIRILPHIAVILPLAEPVKEPLCRRGSRKCP